VEENGVPYEGIEAVESAARLHPLKSITRTRILDNNVTSNSFFNIALLPTMVINHYSIILRELILSSVILLIIYLIRNNSIFEITGEAGVSY
jgi:hypothetical protein